MKQELQDKLYKQYPQIFVQKDLTIQESCMPWGITCGDGWYNIIDNACGLIQSHIDWTRKELGDTAIKQVETIQVKEKFGALRMYICGGDNYVAGVIEMAEAISSITCEICGNAGTLQDGGWLQTLCPKHKNNFKHSELKSKGAVALDFDGVINSYKSGFVAVDDIPDPPVDGAFKFISDLLRNGFKVYIYSTRNDNSNGRQAINDWLLKHGMSIDVVNQIELAIGKPIAKVYIDDRAWEFNGTWPDILDIEKFNPWHGGKSSSQKE